MNTVPISFEFKNLVMPRLDSIFLATPSEPKFQQLIRLEVLIVDDNNLKMLLGIKLVSNEKIDSSAKVDVIVEFLADFKLNQVIPVCNKLADAPCLANMAAVMFPFVREKIYYCLSGNNYSFLLDSVNMIDVLKLGEGNPSFSITDNRRNKQMEMEMAK